MVTGSITDLPVDVDAIVNPANSRLLMSGGGGAASYIKKVGGEIIEQEALKKAPVPVGKAVATSAGTLKMKYVIHAPTMERSGMSISVENVEKAMKGALECAEELKIKSIAIPALGTGEGGVPRDVAAKVMVEIAVEHITTEEISLETIILCDINEEQTDLFSENLRPHRDELMRRTLQRQGLKRDAVKSLQVRP